MTDPKHLLIDGEPAAYAATNDVYIVPPKSLHDKTSKRSDRAYGPTRGSRKIIALRNQSTMNVRTARQQTNGNHRLANVANVTYVRFPIKKKKKHMASTTTNNETTWIEQPGLRGTRQGCTERLPQGRREPESDCTP